MIKPGNFVDVPRPESARHDIGYDVESYNSSIRDQNGRFSESTDLTIQSIKEVVQTEITNEQIDTVQEILEATKDIKFEQIALDSLAAHQEVHRKEHQAADYEQAMEAGTARILHEVHEAIRLAPLKTESITELGRLSIEEYREILTRISQDELASARSANAAADAAFYETAVAWEIPVTLSGSDILAIQDALDSHGKEVQSITEDILPIKPEERKRQAGIVERARHDIENNDASNYITYYLSERANEVVTVEDLIRFLYAVNEEVLENRQYRTRITSLLGPAIQGHRIRRYLHEQYDLELEYGWRYLKEKDGEAWKTRRKTRIYRAVETGSRTEDVVDVYINEHTGRVVDEWEAVSDDAGLLNENTGAPAEAAPTETEAESAEITDQPEKIVPKTAAEETDEAFEKLRADIVVALDKLEHDSLLSDEIVKGSYIRLVSGSNLLGTRTSRERLHAAGIIRVSEVKADQLTRFQLVVSALLNANPALQMRKSKKQRAALDLIEQMLDERLAAIAARKD